MTARERHLIRTYGITQADYDKILESQGGRCAVCMRSAEEFSKNLAVDHCHKEPFIIRGILCTYCNHRLVGRHTDPELLRRIADYLETDTGHRAPKKKPKRRKKRNKNVKPRS